MARRERAALFCTRVALDVPAGGRSSAALGASMRSALAFAALCMKLPDLASSAFGRERPQETTLCALYNHGADYDGHRVTVTARLIVSTSTLYDQHCPKAHLLLTLSRVPPAAACQMRPPTFGCPNETRKYIDGTFSGTFRASRAGAEGQLSLEVMGYSYSGQDAGP